MIPRVTALLAWPVEVKLREAPLVPVTEPANLGDLIAHYRARLPAFRPAWFKRLGKADQARVDGLITAVLMLDGWLDAHADWAAGHAMRLPADTLAEMRVTDSHWREKRVDFAFRRFNEHFAGQIRGVLQGAAALGQPWLGGWRYRLTIARVEQILRERQVDPSLWFTDRTERHGMARPMAAARVAWRVLTGRG
ncbi:MULTISPECIES: hypothetical protein [unclassified Guyparkeria]|uniref:hypothetical protein n=1 Tax=unclassified Guyparkeria TaxID=2626246 RepID=UPI000733743C|nr:MULTISPECIES: hypothetical protein [unclassified Guyparkeria]KTG16122.1 hypothetical protein AUR63_04590 [Guyparkeria sp. XI15]OAE84973.1 hypothetical protein AWR35_04600 [Guyparkeria sp. WRN-7]